MSSYFFTFSIFAKKEINKPVMLPMTTFRFHQRRSSLTRLGLLIAVLLCCNLLGYGLVFDIPKLAMVLGMILFIGLSITNYRVSFITFVFILFSCFDFAGYQPIFVSPIKIYLVDVVIFFMIILGTMILLRRISAGQLKSPITLLLLINLLIGLFALIMGIKAGHLFRDVMGDFRRFFFYPLAALVLLGCPLVATDWSKLIKLFAIVLIIICTIAVARVVTGSTWDPEQFQPAGQFRAIGYVTAAISVMGIGVFWGLFLSTGGRQKWLCILMVSIAFFGAIVSNYRLIWVTALMQFLLVPYLAFGLRGRLKSVILSITISLLIGGVIILCLKYFFPEIWAVLIGRFQNAVLEFQFGSDLRSLAWKDGLNKFLSSPILGTGIGDQFNVWGFDSRGLVHNFSITPHNILLTLLYQGGIVFSAILIFIHVKFIRYVLKSSKRIETQYNLIVFGMFSGYLAVIILAMFQPLMESPGATVVLYVWMGLTIKVISRVEGHQDSKSFDKRLKSGINGNGFWENA
ncbi:conserved hypothetical protein [delta proteobacterium NaphS2]|nr:conserved hypothetical protein [delta proteobacterium NaphS2]